MNRYFVRATQHANQAEFATRPALCNFEVFLSVADRLIGRPFCPLVI